MAPQGSINAVSGGSADRASFIPQSTELEVDLRIAPDSSIDAAQSQLHKALERLKEAEPDLDFAVEFIAGMPGTRTDPESWIVRTLISSYERFESKSHEVLGRTSGASDAALIREAGVQTARIGLPPPATPSPFSGFSMGVADEESMARLARFLIEPAVETASKSRAEVGLR